MVDEYLNDNLLVCMEADSDCWEADLLEQLGQEDQEVYIYEERPDEDDETDNDLPTSKLKNFKEAVQSLDDVQHFLESRGYIVEALIIGPAVDMHSNSLQI